MTQPAARVLRPGTLTAALLLNLFAGIAVAQHYVQTNLVSSQTGEAPQTDGKLINGWGIARSATSPWWVSDNGTGKSTLYNGAGVPNALVVSVPGAPTGTVFNGTSAFALPASTAARFLFASEDGTISGWNGGTRRRWWCLRQVRFIRALRSRRWMETLCCMPRISTAAASMCSIPLFNR